MKRSLILGVLATAICFGALGCSDDESSGGGSGAGGSAASGGSGGSSAAGGSGATGGSGGSAGSVSGGAAGAESGGATSGGGTAGVSGTDPTVSLSVNPSTLSAGDTTVGTVTVSNFVLEQPAGQPSIDGHGHYRIYLDDATGGSYLVTDQVASVDIVIPLNASNGAHTLRVELANNDETPLDPSVEGTASITLE